MFENEQEEEMCRNAFYLFTSESGKPYLEELKLTLLDLQNCFRRDLNETQLAYQTGKEDFIRHILMQVSSYRIWLDQNSEVKNG
jgi:hypothetical protein